MLLIKFCYQSLEVTKPLKIKLLIPLTCLNLNLKIFLKILYNTMAICSKKQWLSTITSLSNRIRILMSQLWKWLRQIMVVLLLLLKLEVCLISIRRKRRKESILQLKDWKLCKLKMCHHPILPLFPFRNSLKLPQKWTSKTYKIHSELPWKSLSSPSSPENLKILWFRSKSVNM